MYEIERGDIVSIRALDTIISGKVSSAVLYEDDGWDIELYSHKYGYTRWREWSDGGEILVHIKADVWES